MRIYVHDYAGHPFQVQLSRELARRGHTVRHGYSSTNLTPQGRLAAHESDPATFTPDPIRLDRPIEKRDRSFLGLLRRRLRERDYGARAAEHVTAFAPDVLLTANTPLDALKVLQRACDARGVPVVNWLQDLLSVGTDRVLRDRIPLLGAFIGRTYLSMERNLLLSAEATVIITDDFRPLLTRWGVAGERMHTIENWAPLDEVPPRPINNAWSREHGLDDKRVILYAGTLGMKHNPELLAELARRLGRSASAQQENLTISPPRPSNDTSDVRVVVVSEGAGADWLRERKEAEGLDNLLLLPFQPFDVFPDVLGAADVLAAILEPEAGIYSVPSKVLSYLCAKRPLLLAMPPENLATQIVQRIGAGVVVPPVASAAFAIEGERLLADPERCKHLAENGRAYAEKTFDIETISDRFEAVLMAAAQHENASGVEPRREALSH